MAKRTLDVIEGGRRETAPRSDGPQPPVPDQRPVGDALNIALSMVDGYDFDLLACAMRQEVARLLHDRNLCRLADQLREPAPRLKKVV
jgi:hypothetical protein